MAEKSSIAYVTTPIYYVNDRPHLGHVYTTEVADVTARYHRLMGDDTFFLTGTDEHAAKVADAAAERGLTPLQWADENAKAFEETFRRLGMSNDDFIRTSQPRHKEKVERYVKALIDSGDVYLGEYEGWYDAGQEEYVPDNKAREQDYISAINGKPLVRKAEKNYFFKLSEYRDPLLELLQGGGEVEGCRFDVQPQARRNEIISRIKDAEDVPISRTGQGDWGIAVPGDSEHTIYVWIDALFNYLTTVDEDARRKYWQAGAVHFIAKDILWFHAAIWPAILLALRKCPRFEWVNLPRVVYAHSYWVSDGQKMSKSLGNFLDPAAIDSYVNEFGLDALRYFLSTRGPLGVSDSMFSHDLFVDVYNSDLANTLGNSCSRVTNMIGKYFGGRTPEPGPPVETLGEYDSAAEQALAGVQERMAKLDLSGAADAALGLVRSVDAYIDETRPFTMAKDEAKLPQVGTVLYNCLEALRVASVLLWPFAPDKCAAFWRSIGCGEYADALADNGCGDLAAWTKWGLVQPGTPVVKGEALFPRYQSVEA